MQLSHFCVAGKILPDRFGILADDAGHFGYRHALADQIDRLVCVPLQLRGPDAVVVQNPAHDGRVPVQFATDLDRGQAGDGVEGENGFRLLPGDPPVAPLVVWRILVFRHRPRSLVSSVG